VSPAFNTLFEAEPVNEAVIVPALKFPEPSLATIVDTVFAEVALEVTVNVVAEPPLKVAEPERPVPEVARVKVFGVLAVTVILAEPLKETPLIVLAVCNIVAVPAFPSILTPVNVCDADALLRAIEVVPINGKSYLRLLKVLYHLNFLQ